MSPPFLSLVNSKCPYCKTKVKGILKLSGADVL
jgi:hypothetical protein